MTAASILRARPHWVSQFLTRPWELNAKRELAFFDFERGHHGRETPSKRLFRESRKRSAELGERLNELIETPFCAAREKLLAPGQVEVDDWKTQRAVALMLFMQAARTQARELQDDRMLATLLLRPDDEVDLVVGLFVRGRQLVRLGNTAPEYSLFYPDTGIFSFMTQDTGCVTGWAHGHAVPVTLSIAYAFVSDTADCTWLFNACHTTHHLQAFSLAGPKVSRVVIPPTLVGHTRTTPGSLLAYRERMTNYVKQLQEVRATQLRGLRAAGTCVKRRDVDGAPDPAERFCVVEDAR